MFHMFAALEDQRQCPACARTLELKQALVACQQCGQSSHLKCWDQRSQCSASGCDCRSNHPASWSAEDKELSKNYNPDAIWANPARRLRLELSVEPKRPLQISFFGRGSALLLQIGILGLIYWACATWLHAIVGMVLVPIFLLSAIFFSNQWNEIFGPQRVWVDSKGLVVEGHWIFGKRRLSVPPAKFDGLEADLASFGIFILGGDNTTLVADVEGRLVGLKFGFGIPADAVAWVRIQLQQLMQNYKYPNRHKNKTET